MPDYTTGATARDVWTYSKRTLTKTQLSDELQIAADTERSTNSTSYEILKDIAVFREGGIRVKWEFRASALEYVYTRLYINGNPVGPEHHNHEVVWKSVQEDVLIRSGDRVQLGARTSNSAVEVLVRRFRIYYSEGPEYLIILD